jgi:hypothetical protein
MEHISNIFEYLCLKKKKRNFVKCNLYLSCYQSAREAEIKLKSESRVKLFYLDPDAQVRCIDGEEKIFGSCLFICLICFGLSSRYNSTENLGKRRKIKTMFSPP